MGSPRISLNPSVYLGFNEIRLVLLASLQIYAFTFRFTQTPADLVRFAQFHEELVSLFQIRAKLLKI
jgi:hypothetical protein